MSDRRKIVVLALTGGALGGAGWLPFYFMPLEPVGLAFVVGALRLARTARQALLVGALFAVARYLVAGHFILYLMRYSWLALAFYLVAVVFVLPFGLLEGGGAWLLGRRSGMPRGVALGVMYALGEKLRTMSDLSFPGDLGAHGFGQFPVFLEWTRWTGPFVVPIWLFSVATLIERTFAHRGDRPRLTRYALATLAVWLVLPAGGLLRGAAPAETDFRVGIVQPVVRVHEKFDAAREPAIRSLLAGLTLEAARGTDLVIWPETARPGRVIWDETEPFADPAMEALSRDVGVPILYGTEIVRTRGESVVALYNGAALVHPDGRPAQWYGKQRLLPFAEAVPFADLIGWEPAYRRKGKKEAGYLTMMGNFSPGPEPTVFEVGPARIGVNICYEGLYPQIAREYRRAGSNLLAVMTNDEWWGTSVFAPHHALMVAARAQENDLPVVRAANSGVSSHTDRQGRLTDRLGMSRRGVLRVDVPVADAPLTFYTRAGDWVVWLMLLVTLGGLVRPWVDRRVRPGPASD